MKATYLILVILILFHLNSAYSQKETDANIVGHVKNKKTGKHLPYINVIVKGTTKGTSTDGSGHYMLVNLPPGKHTLVARGLGYKKVEKDIIAEKDLTKKVDFILEEDILSLEQVIISSNRYETERQEAPVMVNTISSKMIERVSAVNISDALNFTPGLRIENMCQNCGFLQLRMNGLAGPYTQILINNRPVYSALAGVFGLEQIPSNMIDRIEVVRGGGSALYGGNAIAGTINLITKDPLKNCYNITNNLTLTNGEKADANVQFNASFTSQDHSSGISIFGIKREREPWDANDDGFSEVPKLDNNSFGLMSYYSPSSYSKIELDLYNINESRRGGNDFDKPPHYSDISEQMTHDIIGGNINYRLQTKNLNNSFNIYTSAQNVDRDSYAGANELLDGYTKTTELTTASGVQYSGKLSKLLFAPAAITAGAELKTSSLKDIKLGDTNYVVEDQDLENLGIYLQNEWTIHNLKLLIGARYDDHTLLDQPVVSPRGNLLYNISDELQLRLSYAQGFRTPQLFNENLHAEVIGAEAIRHKNAEDLTKETSHSYSGSFDYNDMWGTWQTHFLGEMFYTVLDDPFVHDYTTMEDSTGSFLYHYRRNGEKAEVKGINLEGSIAPSDKFTLQTGVTMQKSLYKEEEIIWEPASGNPDSIVSTKTFPRSPNIYGYLVSKLCLLKRLCLNMSGTYTGRMEVPHMVNPENEYTILEKTHDFFDLNAKLSYRIKVRHEIFAKFTIGVYNIFNSYQQDFDVGINRDAGYVYGPTRPRSILFSIRLGNSQR